MKKTLAILISLAMVLSLAACGKTEEPSNSTVNTAEVQTTETTASTEENPVAGIPNPMVPAESLDGINNFLGCKLVKPGVMGVTDESFYVINEKIGEYDFSVNGIPYTFRFSDETEDISGIYTGSSTLLANAEDGDVIIADGYTGARWFTEYGQYCLTTNGSVDAELFKGIVEEMMGIQGIENEDIAVLSATPAVDDSNESWYENLAGTWFDMTSGRATMEVENCVDHALINVSWGDSASCTYEWTMNVIMEEAAADGTNKLSYTDCTSRKVDSDGVTDTVTVLYENGEGFFTLNQGGFLLWDGAADENCTECMFEQALE